MPIITTIKIAFSILYLAASKWRCRLANRGAVLVPSRGAQLRGRK